MHCFSLVYLCVMFIAIMFCNCLSLRPITRWISFSSLKRIHVGHASMLYFSERDLDSSESLLRHTTLFLKFPTQKSSHANAPRRASPDHLVDEERNCLVSFLSIQTYFVTKFSTIILPLLFSSFNTDCSSSSEVMERAIFYWKWC